MSFDFNSNFNSSINKAQGAYKDGSGMGGGGMYFKQKGKRKGEPDDDLFERSEEKDPNEIEFSELKEDEIPSDNIVNKFVNWFRIRKK